MNSTRRTPSTSNFERKLGEELAALAAERSVAADRVARRSVLRRRPLLAAVAIGVAAVATALVLPAVLGVEHGGNAAYAVTQESDGTIALQLRDPAALADLVATLQRYGVRAAGIEEARTPEECTLPEPKGTRAQPDRVRPGDGPGTVRIDPKLVPPGSTVLLTAGRTRIGGTVMNSFRAVVVDAVPACVPAPQISVPGPADPSAAPVVSPTSAVPPSGRLSD
ncbi:hypothetical protein ACIQF6_14110 [Kitasatospora sp. NPDC092948]|uniref:hypothetical protein n=1 Tax=Kitasatospora sp. NPDC092948 TaxID=3364088 RepID=UPI00381E84DE